MKAPAALPPELRAVTVTRSASAASVGMLRTPVAGSMPAPAPAAAKRSASPENQGAAAIACGPLPWSKISSQGSATSTGGG